MVDIINYSSMVSDLNFLKGAPSTVTNTLTRLYESGSGEVAVMLAAVTSKIKDAKTITPEQSVELELYVKNIMDRYTVTQVGDLKPPVYITYVNEKLTLLSGEAATSWLDSISLDIDSYINPPELILVGADYVPYDSWRHVNAFLELQFAASFVTDVGESGLSNIVSILVGGGVWQSVTLGVEDTKVPDLAKSVRYYRQFNGVFRLVSEVDL